MEYLLSVSAIALPFLAILAMFYVRNSEEVFRAFPDLARIVQSFWMTISVYICLGLLCASSLPALAGVFLRNAQVLETYAKCLFLIAFGLTIVVIVIGINFVYMSGLGLGNSYIDHNWTDLMRTVNMAEFEDGGQIACIGGKYRAEVEPTSDY